MTTKTALFTGAEEFPEIACQIYRSLTLVEGDLGMDVYRDAVVSRASADPRQFSNLHGFFGGAYASGGEFIPESRTTRGQGLGVVYGSSDVMPMDEPAHLVGDCLYAGPLFSHYGHFLTESLARLWPILDRDFSHVVFQLPDSLEPVLIDFQKELFALLGILDRIVIVGRQPVRCDTLVIPEPSIVLANRAHRALRAVFQSAAKACLSRRGAPPARPLYVSRRVAREGVVCGEQNIEAAFMRSGFDAICLEMLTMHDKIALFATAPRVAGFLGSGLHNILFSLEEQEVINLVRFYEGLHSYFLIDLAIGRSSIYIDAVESRLSADFPPFHAQGPFLVPVQKTLARLNSIGIAGDVDISPAADRSAAQHYVREWMKLEALYSAS